MALKIFLAVPRGTARRSFMCPRISSHYSSINSGNGITQRMPALNVTSCKTSVDQCRTVVKEKGGFLHCTSPSFRASATVMFPRLLEGDMFTVGWVQAVEELELFCHYPSGVASLEIPELSDGPVSDACGRQYPWYGIDSERVTIKGPILAQTVRVAMEDYLSSTFNWAATTSDWVRPFKRHSLQGVNHKQALLTWLVLKDEHSGEIQALKGYRWRIEKEVTVDCSKKLGDRAHLVGDDLPDQPVALAKLNIPESAMRPPCANLAQKIMWNKT